MRRIPTTVLTGFLGAGKTTLLNQILHARHARLSIWKTIWEGNTDKNMVSYADLFEPYLEKPSEFPK